MGARARGETHVDGGRRQGLDERTEHKQMERRWQTRLWRKLRAAPCKKKKNQNGEVWREDSERQINSAVLKAKSRADTQKQHCKGILILIFSEQLFKQSEHTRIDALNHCNVSFFNFLAPGGSPKKQTEIGSMVYGYSSMFSKNGSAEIC